MQHASAARGSRRLTDKILIDSNLYVEKKVVLRARSDPFATSTVPT